MYVVLTQDVPDLGLKNGLVNVRRGYFMNFLHPRALAMIPSVKEILRLKDQILSQKSAADQAAKVASEQVKVLNDKKVLLFAKASEKGTLFQGIVEKDVCDAIKVAYSLSIAPDQIRMKHIKKLGDHMIKIKIGEEVVGMTVVVEAVADE